MLHQQLAKAVLPAEVSRAVVTRALQPFIAEYADTLLLLVSAPAGSDVLAGLEQSRGQGGGAFLPARQMGYETAAHDAKSIEQLLAAAARTPETRRTALGALLARGQYYMVALRKRDGADQILHDRISVGRATNKDLVLRDTSVSKFHAWFELYDDREFGIADAGSTNLTRVNDEPLVPKRPRGLSVGDIIHFGSVSAVLTDAEVLWNTVHHHT